MLDKTARAQWLNELFGDIQTSIADDNSKVVQMNQKTTV
jgi:hypothetical protein